MMSAEVKSQPTPTIDVFDFKTKFAETKATAKAIDMELRKLEVQQSNKHVAFLSAFMPESFMQHGGQSLSGLSHVKLMYYYINECLLFFLWLVAGRAVYISDLVIN